jgi:hypothetical protein
MSPCLIRFDRDRPSRLRDFVTLGRSSLYIHAAATEIVTKPTATKTPKQTTTFNKKKKDKEDEDCFVCGSPDHWAKKCPNRKGRKPQSEQKTSNMVVSSSGGGTSGYGNLPYVLSVFQSTT